MKIDRNRVLTDSEIQGFKSKRLYWKEIREREDGINLLVDEVSHVYRMMDVRTLSLIEHYIELLEMERQ